MDTSSSDTGRSHSVMDITLIEMKKTTGDRHVWVSHADYSYYAAARPARVSRMGELLSVGIVFPGIATA